VVWGEHERVCDLRIGRQIAATVPNARLIVINGAGHSPSRFRCSSSSSAIMAAG